MNAEVKNTVQATDRPRGRTKSTRFRIQGMDCPDEITELRDCLQEVEGIHDLAFNLMHATMTVKHDPEIISPEAIADRVNQKTAMRASVEHNGKQPRVTEKNHLAGPLWMSIASGAGTGLGFLLSYVPAAEFHHTTWPSALAYTLAILAAWRYVAPKAIKALVRLKLDMNVLMVVAVIGAVALGEWFEGTTVAFLFMVSHLLETWSVNRARRAIQALMEMSPPTARVRHPDGTEEEVRVEEVEPTSHIVVRPGEKFPLDGRVIEGETSVDQAPITGESAPVPKTVGDEVYAGTVNQDGAVTVEVTKSTDDTVLAGIIRLVEQSQSRRSRSEQFVETFARYYTPAVVIGAVILSTAPPLLVNAAWTTWFYPVTIVSALAAAARNGVLIKGGEYLEAVGRVHALAIDKTGTLTLGKPVVQEIIPVGDISKQKLLEVAATIEKRSEHPIAEAIVRYAAERGVMPDACENYQAIRGKGAQAYIDGVIYYLGNHRLLEEKGLCSESIHRTMLARAKTRWV